MLSIYRVLAAIEFYYMIVAVMCWASYDHQWGPPMVLLDALLAPMSVPNAQCPGSSYAIEQASAAGHKFDLMI